MILQHSFTFVNVILIVIPYNLNISYFSLEISLQFVKVMTYFYLLIIMNIHLLGLQPIPSPVIFHYILSNAIDGSYHYRE